MRRVNYLPGARQDFDESFDWYARRSQVTAERFLAAVSASLNRIAEDPEQFSRVDSRHRECLVRRFPFRVVYRVEADRILVVAVAHAKRRPGFWRRREGEAGSS
jgi:plasmid stabilization system protein ParE